LWFTFVLSLPWMVLWCYFTHAHTHTGVHTHTHTHTQVHTVTHFGPTDSRRLGTPTPLSPRFKELIPELSHEYPRCPLRRVLGQLEEVCVWGGWGGGKRGLRGLWCHFLNYYFYVTSTELSNLRVCLKNKRNHNKCEENAIIIISFKSYDCKTCSRLLARQSGDDLVFTNVNTRHGRRRLFLINFLKRLPRRGTRRPRRDIHWCSVGPVSRWSARLRLPCNVKIRRGGVKQKKTSR